MGILIALAVLAVAALAFGSKPGSSSSGAPPAGSEPEGTLNQGAPVRQTSTAASGRRYTVWMWPPVTGVGVYTVAQQEGTIAWIAFIYQAETNKSIPLKTNVTQVAGATEAQRETMLRALREDWKLNA